MNEREAFQILGQMPHCDHTILHAPTNCKYCDAHPEWQAYRVAMKINFTGERDPDKLPCPSSLKRPAHKAHQWPGNRPTEVDVELEKTPPESYWERLKMDREQD
jgi:hypothetical protein